MADIITKDDGTMSKVITLDNGQQLRMGKKEPGLSTHAPKMSALFGGILPATPAVIDHSVPGPIPMFLNDQLECCTIATLAHGLRIMSHQAKWITPLDLPDDFIKTTYFGLTGGADSGLYEVDVMNWWTTTGVKYPPRHVDDLLVGFAPIHVKSIQELEVAIEYFGFVYCGFNLPETAEEQFVANAPWTVKNANLSGSSQPGSLGGHAVPLMKRDRNAGTFNCYTWQRDQPMNEDFIEAYLDEGYCVVSPIYLGRTGKTPDGFDKEHMVAQMNKLRASV